MYDQVRVFFADGTSTVVYVHEDDDVVSAIAELCDQEGYDSTSVINYAIVATTTGEL